jgi:hypothetical protein
MMGVKTKENQFGTEIITADITEHRKLMMDARKWLLVFRVISSEPLA